MSAEPWTGTSAICVSGHVILPNVNTPDEEAAVPRFCETCGGAVGTRCVVCRYRLAVNVHKGERPRDTTFTARDYCAGCGRPHPWLSRDGALDGLILKVRGDASLGQAEKLAAVQQLEALKALEPGDLGAESEKKLWIAFKGKAGPIWKDPGVQDLLHQAVPHVFKILS